MGVVAHDIGVTSEDVVSRDALQEIVAATDVLFPQYSGISPHRIVACAADQVIIATMGVPEHERTVALESINPGTANEDIVTATGVIAYLSDMGSSIAGELV